MEAFKERENLLIGNLLEIDEEKRFSLHNVLNFFYNFVQCHRMSKNFVRRGIESKKKIYLKRFSMTYKKRKHKQS